MKNQLNWNTTRKNNLFEFLGTPLQERKISEKTILSILVMAF